MDGLAKLNYSALQRQFSREEVKAFKVESTGQSKLILWLVLLIFAPMFLFVLGMITFGFAQLTRDIDSFQIASVIPLFIVIIFSVIIVGVVIALRGNRLQMLRYSTFAEENGLHYIYNVAPNSASLMPISLTNEGAIFGAGHSQIFDHLIGNQQFAIGKYRYTTGSGKNSHTHHWMFAQLKISKKLPHTLFDSKKNNFWKFSNLPQTFKANQVLTSEAEFDNTFNVYVPEGYTIDVLSYVAPDLMEVLIQNFQEFEIEIIDDTVRIYKQGSLSNADVARLSKLLLLLGNELEDNIKTYNASATQQEMAEFAQKGRRLKKSSLPAVVGFGFLFIWFFQGAVEGGTVAVILSFTVIAIAIVLYKVIVRVVEK